MKNWVRLLLCLSILSLGGCIRSIHPLYTDADLTVEPRLAGSWGSDNDDESWVFERNGDKAYRLVYTESNGKTGVFDVHPLKLNGLLFLDFFPADMDLKARANGFYLYHMVAVHTFAHVKFEENGDMKLGFLSPEVLAKQIEEDPKVLAHVAGEEDNNFIVTASTKDLQAYVLKHLGQLIKEDGYGILKRQN